MNPSAVNPHALASLVGLFVGGATGWLLFGAAGSSAPGYTSEMPELDREQWVLQQVEAGAIPSFLRTFVPVSVADRSGNTGIIFVSPDYLSVGSDTSFLRTPLSAPSAQRAADLLGAMLPTKKIVDAIESEARRSGQIIPLTPFSPTSGESRNSQRLWIASNDAIERRRDRGKALYAGHKKDIIVGPEVGRNPGKVIIYGALKDDLVSRWQGPSGVHDKMYRDYSHGVRLVGPVMVANGVRTPVAEVASSPRLWGLVLSEGPSNSLRYPL